MTEKDNSDDYCYGRIIFMYECPDRKKMCHLQSFW